MTRKIGSSTVAVLGAAALAGLVLLAPPRTAPAVDATPLLRPAPASEAAAFDPTRPLLHELDAAFARHWQGRTGESLAIERAHDDPDRLARIVVNGAATALVPLAPAFDVDAPRRRTLPPPEWEKRPHHQGVPYTSTVVFLVRKGNPKAIVDWRDLLRPGVHVMTPDPRSSVAARWNYLAAWGYALRQANGDEQAAREFVARLYGQVESLDDSARGAMMAFLGGAGDALITWESEARLAARAHQPGSFEVVTPSASILTEPAGAALDRVVLRPRARELAASHLDYLYSAEGQEIVARHFHRPIDPAAASRHSARFEPLELFTVEQVFGSWREAQARHFAAGGEFERIVRARR